MERKFVIADATDYLSEKFITETELKRRLVKIFEDDYGLDKSIDTLLHGQPQERDEWDEWVEQMPNPGSGWSIVDDTILKAWFRRMPGRGK